MGRPTLEDEIRDILERQAAAERGAEPTLARQELEFEKWRLIHRYVHTHPFATRRRLPRSRQWQEAANRVRDLGEPEVLDWLLQQAEIARNLERGVRDLRPRKGGPCYAALLEYVANRKRKALAILHFARAGEEQGVFGVNSAFHARTQEILGEHEGEPDRGGGGHEGVPWRTPEEED